MSGKSKTVLITGASSGIGCELAKFFARDGYNLVLVARNKDPLTCVAEQLNNVYGVPVKTIPKDLSLPGSPAELYCELERESIEIDVLVNNAGFGAYGSFAETDLETELAMIHLNVVSLTHLTKLFLKPMLARGEGKILNVASTAAFQPGPLMAVYYATKAHVLLFSEALADELSGSEVTVTALCPGPTRTEFRRRAGMEAARIYSLGSMEACAVARIAYRGLMRNRRIIIPGVKNKLLAFAVRFVPRRLVTRIVRWLQEERVIYF